MNRKVKKQSNKVKTVNSIFIEEIKEELGKLKLSREQVVHFAWRCAVRTLPFLGNDGNFDFWETREDKQKYLYETFYALDVNAAAITTSRSFPPFASGVFAASAPSASAANAAHSYAKRFSQNIIDPDFISAASAASAAFSAYYAYLASAAYASSSADSAADSYAADTAYASASAAANKNIKLTTILLQELRLIKENKEQKISIELYDIIWGNFQKALEAEGCGYWGALYKRIIDNEFKLDQNALEKRMNVPQEIRVRGAAAVADFLEEMENKGAKRFNEARIIILGEKGAGKTSIARRLVNPDAPMPTDNESTAGVDTTLWKLEEEDINVRIWDFSGHTVTHAVHQFFLSERCLYLMVYDGRSEERNRLEYWLNHMKTYGGNSEAIILINKRDMHSINIDINSLKERYSIAKVYNFSIKDNQTQLIAFRKYVARYIENNHFWKKQEIPINYFQVKEELEKFFDKGKEHITREQFEKIAKKNNVDSVERLLKDLHSLGVSLWYEKMEKFNTLILNPEWISYGVYKIINWVNEREKYSLMLDDCPKVFNSKEDCRRYPRGESQEFLFDLMKHYELAYQTEYKNLLIIPHLLETDRPQKLPEFPIGKSLMLRYVSDHPLPSNTISRFIVRHNQEIKRENDKVIVWRYGVVLDDGNDSLALVREEDRTISVSVKGKNKTSYISVLRETLNDIFNSYKSKKPELQYEIESFGQILNEVESGNSLWLADRKIINHFVRDKLYYDDITDQDIPMEAIVNIYNIDAKNAIVGGEKNSIKVDSFNFHNCNIELQGNLNYLAQLLTENGNKEDAKELENIAEKLKQVKDYKSEEEVKESGMCHRLNHLVKNLVDENSKLHKTVNGIANGVNIVKNIIQACSDIAQW